MKDKKYTALDMASASLWGSLFILTILIIINHFLGV